MDEAFSLLGYGPADVARPAITAPAVTRSVATPSVGLAGAVAALPLVEPFVTREGTTWRVALIQKDPRRGAQGPS